MSLHGETNQRNKVVEDFCNLMRRAEVGVSTRKKKAIKTSKEEPRW
jgi:hypothetical protein